MLYSDALTEVFHRHDLDSNGAISRNKFDFFCERTDKELCDGESWKAFQGNERTHTHTHTHTHRERERERDFIDPLFSFLSQIISR